jgi:predicted anti-sigma-YlaC factor YlaD
VTVEEIVCREFAELATDYLEGALPGETLELVEEHLAMCDWCRSYTDQLEVAVAAVAAAEVEVGPDAPAGAAPDGPPPEALGPLMDAFRRRRQGGAAR